MENTEKTNDVKNQNDKVETPIDELPDFYKQKLKKKLIFSSVAVILLLILSSWFYVHENNLFFQDTRFLMNTAYTIKVYGIRGYLGMQAAFRKIAEIEKQTSFYNDNSGLTKLNKTGKYNYNFNNKFGRDLLREIAIQAKFIYENTEGYFDPSFAALHELYGFHTIDKTGRLPSDKEIAGTLLNCGYSKVLTINENNLKLKNGSMIDFGGIVGGFSIIYSREILKKAGCKAFLIDDAGDIWFEGEKPDKSPWRVAVKDPHSSKSLAMIESKEPLAISTSGDYERYVTVDGKKYGHIMDPKTGRPASYYDSVTVVTNNPIQSDVLSTALFAMPPEKAYKWADEKGIAALFLDKNGKLTLTNKGKLYFTDLKTN